jgi:hypothetical protein
VPRADRAHIRAATDVAPKAGKEASRTGQRATRGAARDCLMAGREPNRPVAAVTTELLAAVRERR